MKKITLFFAFIPLFSFTQMTEIEIEKKLTNSPYYQLLDKNSISKIAKTYFCIQKKYDIDLSNENDLLSKVELLKKHPNWKIEDKFIEYHTIYSEMYNNGNINNIYKVYPKCYKRNPNN